LIRNLHFSDFLKLGQMHQAEVGLNLPNAIMSPPSPLTAALLQQLPVQHQSSSVYIYEEGRKPSAFLQARTRHRREEWEVISLGTIGAVFSSLESPQIEDEKLDNETPETITEEAAEEKQEQPLDLNNAWLQLIEHTISEAGEKGVQRIYARLSTESAELGLFTSSGFHAYTHESLYMLDYRTKAKKPADLHLNPQRKRNLWDIQRLYDAVTPNPVMHAEQLRSDSWDISRNYFPGAGRETGWVLSEEQSERAGAYIRITSYRNKHLLRIMNVDLPRERLPELFLYALACLKAGEDTQVFCAVRDYETEQETVLEELGFKYFARQAVLVKHTAHLIKVSEKAVAHVRDRRIELPQTTVSVTKHSPALQNTKGSTQTPKKPSQANNRHGKSTI